MSLDIRAITADEVLAYRRAVRTGFLLAETIDDEQLARDMFEPFERCLASFDGTEMVATLQSFPLELTLPGGATVPTGGVSAVTCRGTHRRQGLLTQMITRDLTDSRERGEVADILIAAEYPIYGRFGYGPAVFSTTWELDTTSVRFTNAGEGTVQFVDNATYRKEAPVVFDRIRRARAGMIDRDTFTWDAQADLRRSPEDKPWQGFRVLCSDDDGVVQGYASYTIKRDWNDMRPQGLVEVSEMAATTPAAQARLWRYLAELDWIVKVKAGDRPVDEMLPWLLADGRHAKQTNHADFIWVRPLDVSRLLTARTYTSTGTLVVEVVDPQGLAGGRFLLDASPDGAMCAPTTDTADLTMPIAALGAASLGGASVQTLARAGWLDEHTEGAVDRASAMLGTPRPPWCNTWF